MANGFLENSDRRGFTLVELLVTMAVGGIVLAAIYSASISQSRAYAVQGQVVAMQQNLRAGMFFMERDLRMAGYNPSLADPDTDALDNDCDGTSDEGDADPTDNSEEVIPGLAESKPSSIRFTKDDDENRRFCDPADTGEDVTYSLNVDDNLLLRRDNNSGADEIIAENIEALYFEYLNEAGTALDFTVSPPGSDPALTPADRAKVRSVQITLVARTSRKDAGYTDNTGEVLNLQEETLYEAPADGFRRRVMSAQVNFRNLGD